MKVYGLGEYHGDVIHSQIVDGVHFAITRRKRGETVPRHSHSHASILTLVSGDHHYIDPEGNIRNSLPGAWYYSPPNQTHTHEACRTDIVSAGIQFSSDRFPLLTTPANTILRGTTATFAFSILQDHLSNFRATSPDVLTSILHLLRATIADEGQEATTPAPIWLTRLKQKLDANFLNPLNVDQISHEVGIHPSHMARAFRAEFGQTVTAYIRDRRLEWSLDAIKSTSEKLGVIAVRAGFADQAHFSREFKKRYGHAPSIYR